MSMPDRRITRDDIAERLRHLKGQLDERAERARPRIVSVALGAGALVVVGAYLLGRRHGRARSALVELRRL
jgi:hypothetical protein